MKAFVYEKAGGSRLVRDFPEPRAQSDTAVVQVLACSVCGTDLRAWQYGNERITPPRITGHEICGEIVDIGAGRTDSGSASASRWHRDRMRNLLPCSRGFTNLCDNLRTIGFQSNGGFAEYMEFPLSQPSIAAMSIHA